MRIDDFAYTAVECMAANLKIEYTAVPESHRFEMQPAPVERFVYILNGRASFFVQDGCVEAHARDRVYVPRGTAYSSHWHFESDFVVVDLSLCDADGKKISFGDAPCILFHDEFCVYDGLLRELADKKDEKDPFNWLERTSLCLKFLCEMARDTKTPKTEDKHGRIKDAVTYLENNFAKDFSIDELARVCYLSPTSFRRQFFECMGTSPVDYRNSLRIRRAAELLKNGKLTVSEAAERVGINDVKYFGKLFRRYIGTTPRAFKTK